MAYTIHYCTSFTNSQWFTAQCIGGMALIPKRTWQRNGNDSLKVERSKTFHSSNANWIVLCVCVQPEIEPFKLNCHATAHQRIRIKLGHRTYAYMYLTADVFFSLFFRGPASHQRNCFDWVVNKRFNMFTAGSLTHQIQWMRQRKKNKAEFVYIFAVNAKLPYWMRCVAECIWNLRFLITQKIKI